MVSSPHSELLYSFELRMNSTTIYSERLYEVFFVIVGLLVLLICSLLTPGRFPVMLGISVSCFPALLFSHTARAQLQQ